MAWATATVKSQLDRVGMCLAGVYCASALLIFALIEVTTRPENVGYDWIPFVALALPWYWINPRLLVVGLLLNAICFYLLGVLIHKIWSRVSGRRG
jgi:hypothetical protein